MLDPSAGVSSAVHAAPPATAATPWFSNSKIFIVSLLFVTALIIAPLWMVDYPGMVDYPNHLVRCYILAHIPSDTTFAARYTVVADPIPNLGIEAIVVPLNHALPILVSGKIFLTLMALLYIAGCLLLGRAITGKQSWIALAAAFTFYNSNLLAGFVNYIFGVALFLCIFAYWLQVRRHLSWFHFAVLCVLSVPAFLVHLSCIACLAACCGILAALDFWRDRRPFLSLRQVAWLVFPVLLMSAFMKRSGQVGLVEWSSATKKFIHMFAPVRSYSIVADALLLIVGCAAVALILRTGRLNRVAAAAGCLFFLFLVTPHELFNSSAVDARYLMPAFLVLVLSIEPAWRRRESLLFAALMATLVVHTVAIASSWSVIDRREAHLLQMGDKLPENARVLVGITPDVNRVSGKLDRGFLHVVNLWTITHHAAVSTLFTKAGMQPLVTPERCLDVNSKRCLEQYDYVLLLDPDTPGLTTLHTSADLVERWESVTLWRLHG